jgi:hypothetical protein
VLVRVLLVIACGAAAALAVIAGQDTFKDWDSTSD